MQLKTFLCSALSVSAASAQSLVQALNSTANLSAVTGLIAAQPALLSALGQASNITLLAPSNNAIAAFLNSSTGKAATSDAGLIQAVLTYHVLNGTYYASAVTNSSQFLHTLLSNATYANVTGGQVVGASMSNGSVIFTSGLKATSKVTQANLNFTGGVIHVMDTLLTLPQNISTTAIAANLTALAGAATKAGLVSTLDTLKDVTVFAPTNDAFAAIGSAAGNLSTTDLTNILEYHVINGTVGYSSLLKNETLTTVAGKNLTITIVNGEVYVNSAHVVNPDVLVANGVVHVIDSVLNPSNTTVNTNSTVTSAIVAFSGVSSVSSGVPFTSGVPTPSSSIAAAGTATTGAVASAKATASSSALAAAPMKTGIIGAAALFGGAAVVANW